MDFARTQAEADSLRGEAVHAADGDKVGEVDKVLYDKATGKPEWIAVTSGLLGLKSRIVPFQGADRRQEGIFLRHSKSLVDAAPELEGDEISQDVERQLASHYGLQYSESRSPTGLAGGQQQSARPQRRSSRSRKRQRRQTTARTAASRRSRSTQGPTREELYEQAKRLGIEGRSKMNKAQLARAVGRTRGRRSGGSRTQKANPFEVQKFLEAVGYPASKRELVEEAKAQGADTKVRRTLERLPQDEFDNAADVSRAIGQLS